MISNNNGNSSVNNSGNALKGVDKVRSSNIRKGIKAIAHRVKVQDYAIGQLIKSTNSQFLQSGFEDCQTQLAEIIETLEGIEGILALAEKLTPEELAEADEDFENMGALEKIC